MPAIFLGILRMAIVCSLYGLNWVASPWLRLPLPSLDWVVGAEPEETVDVGARLAFPEWLVESRGARSGKSPTAPQR